MAKAKAKQSLPDDAIEIVVTDRDRRQDRRVVVKKTDRDGNKVFVEGRWHVHVDEAADGTWRYVPLEG